MNPYFYTDHCVKRLYSTYLKHENLIIALDFDSTIYDFHKEGHTYEDVINIIKECNELNFHIIIFTASRKERYEFIAEYCEELGIKINCINKNSIDSPFGNEGKPFFNICLDDRSGLGQSYEILRKTLDLIYKQKQLTGDGQKI